jgi:hypothetical protein
VCAGRPGLARSAAGCVAVPAIAAVRGPSERAGHARAGGVAGTRQASSGAADGRAGTSRGVPPGPGAARRAARTFADAIDSILVSERSRRASAHSGPVLAWPEREAS